jgi:hypothetical protein
VAFSGHGIDASSEVAEFPSSTLSDRNKCAKGQVIRSMRMRFERHQHAVHADVFDAHAALPSYGPREKRGGPRVQPQRAFVVLARGGEMSVHEGPLRKVVVTDRSADAEAKGPRLQRFVAGDMANGLCWMSPQKSAPDPR